MKRLFVALTAVLAIGLASAQDRTIELGYVLWDSEIASTHVVAAVLMDELGYDVELTSVDAPGRSRARAPVTRGRGAAGACRGWRSGGRG